jgi:hypothetical protein
MVMRIMLNQVVVDIAHGDRDQKRTFLVRVQTGGVTLNGHLHDPPITGLFFGSGLWCHP